MKHYTKEDIEIISKMMSIYGDDFFKILSKALLKASNMQVNKLAKGLSLDFAVYLDIGTVEVYRKILTVENYIPYCPEDKCGSRKQEVSVSPRRSFYKCSCGWTMRLSKVFMDVYDRKWSINLKQ